MQKFTLRKLVRGEHFSFENISMNVPMRRVRQMACAMLAILFAAFNTTQAQTTVVFTATGTTGSYITGSTNGVIKNDGNMTGITSTTYRGWASFDLSSIPAGAIISAASISFTTFGTSNSTSTTNEIHGFTGDPATLSEASLYSAIGALTNNVISAPGSWTINTLVTKNLNAAGISFLQSNITSTKVNIGFLRGSAIAYNIYGYDGNAGTGQPALSVTYSTASAPPGCASGLLPANGANAIPINGALTWQAPASATSYDVYLGTSSSPPLITTVTATTYPFSPNLLTNTTYYYKIVPKNTAGDATGCTVQSFTTSALQVYCTPPATNCSQNDNITNVTMGSLNNSGAVCNANGYTDYSGLIAVPTLPVSQLQPMSVTVGAGAGGSEYVGVWIDFNQNGAFESSEFTDLGFGNGSAVTGNINIPGTALLGTTKMRVRVKFGTALTGTDACSGYSNGETEDYVINLTACSYPVISSVSNDTTVCAGSTVKLYIKSGILNNASEWKWYTGSCGETAAGSSDTITVSPTVSTSYFVRGEGGCVVGAGCKEIKINVNKVPLAPIVFPITPICRDSIRALEVSGSLAVSTFSSGTIALNVPDFTAAGVSSVIAASGIPPGVTITGMRIKLTMAHTYPGDMIMNLKAPNGKIINLYKYNGGTYTGLDGQITIAGWFDAEVNSYDTTSFYNVQTPYQYGLAPTPGPYKPDLLNTPIPNNDIQNPNGFVPNANGFPELYSVPNGNWTLALADGGPEDLGKLTNWSITFNYILPKEFDAVWSPAANLFTDAAASIPYDGVTPAGKVYAKPPFTTTYSATAVNGTCVSPTSTDVTVIVNQPISDIVTPGDKTVCEFTNTEFIVSSQGTNPSYQWLLYNGTDTIRLTDGGNYAGTKDDTLIIKAPPYAFNGYKYGCIITSIAPCTTFDTSAAATLHVNPTPVVTIAAAPLQRLLPGLTTTVSAVSTPAAADYTWYKNDVAISATGDNYIVDVDNIADYKVKVVDINGCTSTSNVVSIKDSVSGKLFVFPNPNNGHFQVRYHSVIGNILLPRLLLLYDSKGALVMNKQYTINKAYDEMDVDLSAFGRGLYFINLLDAYGNRLATGKVVVQ